MIRPQENVGDMREASMQVQAAYISRKHTVVTPRYTKATKFESNGSSTKELINSVPHFSQSGCPADLISALEVETRSSVSVNVVVGLRSW